MNMFVNFSTLANGDFKVVVRQCNDISRQYTDLELDSSQFVNVLFQFKALERQLLMDTKQSDIDNMLTSFMPSTSNECMSYRSSIDPAGAATTPAMKKKQSQRKRKLSDTSTQTES